jgi:uncharacterized protein (TIGR03083 family)
MALALNELSSVDRDQLAAPVPVCPGWTVADVLTHTTNIHRWVVRALHQDGLERPEFPQDPPPDGVDLLGYVGEGATLLTAALHDVDLEREVFTWAGPGAARWWLRRMVHENAIHAWDAHLGAGDPSPIPATTAVDTVDEMLDVFFPKRFKPERFAGHGETMHLHATDVEGEWFVRFEPEAVVVTREHAKGDVAARGTASDLALFLWSRVTPDVLDTFGNVEILERYQGAARF